jgi:hypothetical protein
LVRLRSEIAHPGAVDPEQAVIPTIVPFGGARLQVFSATAATGPAQAVAAGEIRIELVYPADEATAAFFRSFAAT